MAISDVAGQPADPSMLVDLGALESAYYERRPDPRSLPSRPWPSARRAIAAPRFSRRSTRRTSSAMTAAICAFRRAQGTRGPLFMGRDTHALSGPAFETALEVLVADGVDVRVDAQDGYTPTPAVSHAILRWNRAHPQALADGIVVTPSHNPPADGGFKYDPPTGGPADAATTRSHRDAGQCAAPRRLRARRSSPHRGGAPVCRRT